jgi:hypothetical protein
MRRGRKSVKDRPALRVAFPALLLIGLSACTNGIDAGKKGGVAFIGLTIMLLAMLFVLWLILGRED